MKLINSNGIPEQIIRAMMAKDDQYYSGKSEYMKNHPDIDYEFSVTTLAQPPQKVQLTKRHWNEIEIDARDRYYLVMGSVIHSILEGHPNPGDLVEERFGRTVTVKVGDKNLKVHLHGCADVINLERGYIEDWKYVSMMAMNFPKDDYIAQLNALKFLLPDGGGAKIKELRNNFIFRDWRSSDAKAGRSPQELFCKVVHQPIWPDEQVKVYLKQRLIAHIKEVEKPDDQLTECTREELWYSRDGFKISFKTKKGEWSKTSGGWASTEEEALAIVKAKGWAEYKFDKTTGKPRRCDFCEARDYCWQHKRMAPETKDNPEEIEL